MKRFQDYILQEEFAETRGALIFRAKKKKSRDSVILKVLKTQSPSLSQIARYNQEFKEIAKVDHPGVIRVLEVIESQDGFAVVTEDNSWPTLETCLQKNKFDLKAFLKVGAGLAETLAHLHQNEIIHQEIKPSHIYVNEESLDVKISDFGAETLLTRKNDNIYSRDVISRGLAYISPEQTGRMNRRVDYRTDIYSLGVVFYEMLTGSPPFISEDPMELIHSHLAVNPLPPEELDAEIPKVVSDIIIKMLCKNAEERYQNALGLAEDLQFCLNQLQKADEIEPFRLGKKDIPRRFNLPQKLYGREEEIRTILDSFENVCLGMRQMVMVSGLPGIGKSALVHLLHKPIVAKRGFFITGKFEQYRKDVPYSGIIQAFHGLIQQILSLPDDRIESWKRDLEDALGTNGRVVSNVINDIDLILGEQPDLPELGPEETRNRFNMVFEKFISVFAKSSHPLVIFLDDLQWADSASLEMINNIASSDDISCLFIIGTYRENEVGKHHPLTFKLREMEERDIKVATIKIGPITEAHISSLIEDNLKSEPEQCRSLASLVYKKTGGNPFFVNQFLKTLYDDHLIRIDARARWQWDIKKISDMQVTDNLVDLLVQKINRLKKDTRETLKIGACIGNRFDLEMIAHLEEQPVEVVLENLKEAVYEGLIDGSDSLYFYHHDRIQEAAYSLLEKRQKSYIHYRIGKKAVQDAAGGELNGRLFYIADQLNAGVEWITGSREKAELIRYNFEAGDKAKASAAYETALEYYRAGLKLLGDSCWKKQYGKMLNVYAQMVEIHYLLGHADQMEKVAAEGRANAATFVDQTPFTATLIKAYTSRKQLDKAIEAGLEMLSGLGIELSAEPDDAQIGEAFQRVTAGLEGKTDEDLLSLPDMKSPEMKAASRIVVEMASAAYLKNPMFSSLLWLELMQVHLKYGMHPLAAFAFLAYGTIMLTGLGDISSGERYGKLAFRLLEKYDNRNFLARLSSTYNLMICHWVEPAERAASAGLDVYSLGMETGQVEAAAYGLFLNDTYSIATGMPMPQLEKMMSEHGKIIKKLNQQHISRYHFLYHQMVLNLMGKRKNPLKLSSNGFDEARAEKEHIKNKEYSFLCNFYMIKFILFFVFEEYEEALAYLKKAEALSSHIRGLINSPHLTFFGALARLAVYDSLETEEKQESIALVENNLAQLRHWESFAPVNFSHRCKMVEAMKAQVKGDLIGAMDLYDETIFLCRKNGYEYEIGFAASLAGYFFMSKGKKRLAYLYLKEAYQNNIKTGKDALVRYYAAKYPILREDSLEGDADRYPEKGDASRRLDMETVIKASQAISGEIVLENLLKKMMQIVLENAGAQQGYMILAENNTLFVEAECNAHNQEISVLNQIPLDRHSGYSSALIHYVARTSKTIILDHACEEGDFTQDAHFRENQSKSVLCQPIISQGRVVGVLYLENNLAKGVFTWKHLEILQIISSQAAISIENAKLYANLEQKVKERTKELEDAYEKIKLLANTDPLTGLSNRRDMMEKIDAERRRLGRNKSRAAIVLSDIDNFKNVNDTYGHDCGDFVLKTIADIMKSIIREQDHVARWGGEEFLFLLPQTGLEGAGVVANKVREEISGKKIRFGGVELSVSMTFGVSCFDDPGRDVAVYLKKADDALYKGKTEGKNRVVFSG